MTANATEPPTEPIFRIEVGAHTARIVGIATDSQGRWAATASDGDKTARLYEMATGKLIRTFRPPIDKQQEGSLHSIALSPDGATIAVGGFTGATWDKSCSIYLFDTASGALTRRISGLPDVISTLAISADGTTLAAGLREKNGIRLFRLSDGAELGRDTDYGGDSFSVHFAADGRVVSSSVDGYIRLYAPLGTADSAAKGAGASRLRLIAKKETPAGCVPVDARFSPNGERIAVGYMGGANLDILGGNDLNQLNRAGGMYEDPEVSARHKVYWSPDGRTLYANGYLSAVDYGMYLWKDEGKGGKEEIAIKDKGIHISALAVLPHGDLLLGTVDSSLLLLGQNGELRRLVTNKMANFTAMRDEFLLSENGSEVSFQYEEMGKPYRFDLAGRSLSAQDDSAGKLLYKRITVNPWKDGKVINPQLFLPGQDYACIVYNTDAFAIAASMYGAHRFYGGTVSLGKVWSHEETDYPHACNISRDGRVATAAYGDGTIHWYRMTDGKELLAFFPHADKKRWVLWTPEGFFDHSPGGEELIGYHLNRGKDKEAEFIPVSKLYNTYYRPDLVNAAFEGKDISAYAKAIDINKLLTTKTLAPKVRFLTQAGQAEKPEQEISAEICDNGGGIGDVTLYLNGMPIAMESGGRGLKLIGKGVNSQCYTFCRTLTLDNGDNVISLMACNSENSIESERPGVTIRHTSSFTGKPNLHILTIAVDKYRDGDLQLKYSRADANGVAELLKSKGKGLFGTITRHTLVDGEVTKEKLEETFGAIGKIIRREDMFILFIAGHGITYGKDGAFYFLPVNFRYSQDDDIPRFGVSMNDFKRYLANIQASKSLLLLDTCNSGSFSEAIASRGILEKTAINKLTRAVGRHTIVASSKSQVALEGYEGHGAFSWILLDGMKGKAANHKGQITVNSLVSYVESALPELTYKKWGYEQIPQKSLVGEDFQIGMR